jgi:GTP-binding protein
MGKPIVALIGRPNTGKSTLFNKIVGERKAITNKFVGTTRDIVSKEILWAGKSFQIFDTGGLQIEIKTKLEKDVQTQTEVALKKADIILFVVDAKEGLKHQDQIIASNLRKKRDKKIIVVVNKADDRKLREQSFEFYKLGLGEPLIISAVTGTGAGDLLDKIASFIEKEKEKPTEIPKKIIKVGIFGKTNVGKSSLLNAILGETRVLVSEIPGTTRDTIDTLISYDDHGIILTDTAGIRRKAKIKLSVEKFSIEKSLATIKVCDICLLVLDAKERISHQDLHIASEIVANYKGVILVINKWDLIKKNLSQHEIDLKMSQYIDNLQAYFPFLYWAPVIFTSAKVRENIDKILDLSFKIFREGNKVIPKDELENLQTSVTEKFYIPGKLKKKKPEIKKFVQVGISPPKFELVASGKVIIPNSYLNTLEKKLREKFGFQGTPILIKVRKME